MGEMIVAHDISHGLKANQQVRTGGPRRRDTKDHRPRFTKIDDQTFDPFAWDLCFLLGTRYAPKLWQLVLGGHAVTGDIVAPIRKLGEAKRNATRQDAVAVAEALVKIRAYFMPKRAKQKF